MTPPTNIVTGQPSESFPGQYEGEKVLIFVRRHWMAFFGWGLLVLVMLTVPSVVLLSIISVAGPGFFQGSRLIYTALAICVFLLTTNAVFLTAWIEHYLDVAILTSERLIHISQIGLFNRHVAELSLLRVQDVSARTNGYLQTVFQYGSVEVESAGDAPNFIMRFAPQPQVIANTILTLHDRLATKEGTTSLGEVGGAMHDEHLPALPANTPPAGTRQQLINQVPMARPPGDFRPEQFKQDLFTLPPVPKASHRTTPPATPPESPNRLPPAPYRGTSTGPTSRRAAGESVSDKIPEQGEGDLEEGEAVSLD